MNSMMTAKIGTPRMNAAKFRWIWAITQIASREPIQGKARYAASFCSWAQAGVARQATAAATRRTGTRRSSRDGSESVEVRGDPTVVVPKLLRSRRRNRRRGRPESLVPIVTRTSPLCRAAGGPLSRASGSERACRRLTSTVPSPGLAVAAPGAGLLASPPRPVEPQTRRRRPSEPPHVTAEVVAQALLSGLLMGCVYALIAAGLSLIFGLMEIVN